MEKAKITYRISPFLWLDDRRFAEILEALEENRAGFDDVALFSSFVHSPVALPTMRERAALLPRRYQALRERGFGAGVNLLCVMGFFPENLSDAPHGFTPFTWIDGNSNAGSFCFNDPEYRRDYLQPLLEMLAAGEPDFIWFDDDIRGHCLCDRCVARWNAAMGRHDTRESLRAALRQGTPEERLQLRWELLRASGRNVTELYTYLARTVHAVAPRVELGAMYVMGDFGDDLDFAAWDRALADGGTRPVRWRPGGGTYTDKEMDEFLLQKGMRFGQYAAWMPEELTNLQSEIENFFYQRLKKSRHATAMEACLYNACGMTGTAWNVLDGLDALEVYRPLMRTLTAVRPFLDRQVQANGRLRPRGIFNGWTPRIITGTSLDGDWAERNWHDTVNPHATELFAAGLPPAFRPEEAELTILNGFTAWTLSEEQLRGILSGGLYCDVETVRILEARGFGAQVGFTVGDRIDCDARERLTAHWLNAGAGGRVRDCRQSFNRIKAWQLKALDERCAVLAELVDYRDQVIADCTMGAFENDWGGRVVVAGYFPLRDLLFSFKMTQLKHLFQWLAPAGLSGFVASYHRVALWVRGDAAERVRTVSLVNASMDPAEAVKVVLQTGRTRWRLSGMYGDGACLTGVKLSDGALELTLPELRPWQVYLLEIMESEN